jgi:hypothetical protein
MCVEEGVFPEVRIQHPALPRSYAACISLPCRGRIFLRMPGGRYYLSVLARLGWALAVFGGVLAYLAPGQGDAHPRASWSSPKTLPSGSRTCA